MNETGNARRWQLAEKLAFDLWRTSGRTVGRSEIIDDVPHCTGLVEAFRRVFSSLVQLKYAGIEQLIDDLLQRCVNGVETCDRGSAG